jgi:hypothetical protein
VLALVALLGAGGAGCSFGEHDEPSVVREQPPLDLECWFESAGSDPKPAFDPRSAYYAVLLLGGGVDVGPQELQELANFPGVALVVACQGYADAEEFRAAGVASADAIEDMIAALLYREDEQQLFVLGEGDTQPIVAWFPIRSWSDPLPDSQISVFRHAGDQPAVR